jgi:hypothetical protein
LSIANTIDGPAVWPIALTRLFGFATRTSASAAPV